MVSNINRENNLTLIWIWNTFFWSKNIHVSFEYHVYWVCNISLYVIPYIEGSAYRLVKVLVSVVFSSFFLSSTEERWSQYIRVFFCLHLSVWIHEQTSMEWTRKTYRDGCVLTAMGKGETIFSTILTEYEFLILIHDIYFWFR